MTDAITAAAPAPDAPKSDGQVAVALTVVIVLAVLGVGLIIAGVICVLKGHPENALWLGLGTVCGSLGTALNAPTGVANALAAIGKPKTGA